MQLVSDPALGVVQVLRREQHFPLLLLFLLLFFLVLRWLLTQVNMEEPALPVLGTVSAILCVACPAPACKLQLAPVPASGLVPVLWHDHISYSIWFSSAAVSGALAADAISYGGACPASFGSCFCSSMCCLSRSCAFELQLAPVPALGLVPVLGHEQHLLLLVLWFLLLFLSLFLLKGCWYDFMCRRLFGQFWKEDS